MINFYDHETSDTDKVFLLTLLLAALTSCKQAEQNENNLSVETLATELAGTQNNDIDLNEAQLGETALGIGLVAINFDGKTILPFYATPNENEPKKTLEFLTI